MRSFQLVLTMLCAMVPATVAGQSLSGEWDASMETPGGVRTFKIVLQVDGEKVAGTVKRPAGEVPLAGTLKGDTLTFSYTIAYDGNPLVLTVSALVRGNTMQGTVDFGGSAQAEFSATRAPAAARPSAGHRVEVPAGVDPASLPANEHLGASAGRL